jgi:hypothetical protein
MSREYVIEGWGKAPFDELYRIQQLDSARVLSSDKRQKKFFPILKGDSGEEATFTEITIDYEGDLW